MTTGDMTSTRVPGAITLAVLASAAAHLEPGGCVVAEVLVPRLRRVPPGQDAWVFTPGPDHAGIGTPGGTAGQIAWPITGSRPAGGWCATARPTGTCGHPGPA